MDLHIMGLDPQFFSRPFYPKVTLEIIVRSQEIPAKTKLNQEVNGKRVPYRGCQNATPTDSLKELWYHATCFVKWHCIQNFVGTIR